MRGVLDAHGLCPNEDLVASLIEHVIGLLLKMHTGSKRLGCIYPNCIVPTLNSSLHPHPLVSQSSRCSALFYSTFFSCRAELTL